MLRINVFQNLLNIVKSYLRWRLFVIVFLLFSFAIIAFFVYLITIKTGQKHDLEREEKGFQGEQKKRTATTEEKANQEALNSQIAYEVDALHGTVYLNFNNTEKWNLVTLDGHFLINPIDFTVNQNKIFFIDSGTIYEGDLSTIPSSQGGNLIVKEILTSGMKIDGYPIKQIAALDAFDTANQLFVLDQSNDVYRFDIIKRSWHLERISSSDLENPAPLYLNLSTYGGRLYLLDQARNQVWRHSPNHKGDGVLPGTLPWRVKEGEPDVTGSFDLAVDYNVFVLFRDGTVVTYDTTELRRFNIKDADRFCNIKGFEDLPIRPTAMFTNTKGELIYIADSGHRRLVAIDKQTSAFAGQFVAPDNPDFSSLRGVIEKESYLYMLAGNSLYRYFPGSQLATFPLEGKLPELVSFLQKIPSTLSAGNLLPNDPRLPYVLQTYEFTMPLRNAFLPDRSAVYPGSRRAYRYGVHEGLDLATKDVGVEVNIDTPVYAAGDGTVLRADVDYKEMTLAEVTDLLKKANAQHITSPDILNKLGGRQIRIDHGSGVATVYSHLYQIQEGVNAGQRVRKGELIGYVGLSGTPEGIKGSTYFPHLHFEIRVGYNQQYYLGQWLNIEETRRAFETIFPNVQVRPAYLDFRES